MSSPEKYEGYETYLLGLTHARRADDDGISKLSFQEAVVGYPAEGNLHHRQAVLLNNGLDVGERFKVGLFPVNPAERLVEDKYVSQ